MALKILKCYPFAFLNPPVRLVEGFAAYDGALGDKRGALHKGIDYARKDKKNRFISFDVFSTHNGEAFQGISKSWGKFVIITKKIKNYKYRTVYAHLRVIDKKIPVLLKKEKNKKKKGLKISECRFLGKAGITGWTKKKNPASFRVVKKRFKKKECSVGKIRPLWSLCSSQFG